jgi:hypothetical protein
LQLPVVHEAASLQKKSQRPAPLASWGERRAANAQPCRKRTGSFGACTRRPDRLVVLVAARRARGEGCGVGLEVRSPRHALKPC